MKRILPLIVLVLLSCSCSKQKISREILEEYVEAKTLYIKGNLDQALPKFKAINNKAPRFSSNSFMLGKLHFFNKNYKEAEEIWAETLKRNPDHLDTIKWLSRLYLIRDKAGKAESLVTGALGNSSEDPELLILMGKIKRAQSKLSAAIEFYIKAQAFEEKIAEAHIDLAEIYREFGLDQKAEQELEKAVYLLGEESSLSRSIGFVLETIKMEREIKQ